MTELEIRRSVIDTAKCYYGVQEGSERHKELINLYNSVLPRPRGHKMSYTDSWCDAYVTVVGDLAGTSELIGRECGCEEHVKIFKSLGIWEEDGTIVPKPADIIVYNWDDQTQPNDGYSDHIGYVVEVNGATGIIKVIEGNHLDQVGYRNIMVGDGRIRGYAKPRYDLLASPIYFYENLGWNRDEQGWWYVYGREKGQYHKNNVVRFPDKDGSEKLWAFDAEGYLCNPTHCTVNPDGSLFLINGERIKP